MTEPKSESVIPPVNDDSIAESLNISCVANSEADSSGNKEKMESDSSEIDVNGKKDLLVIDETPTSSTSDRSNDTRNSHNGEGMASDSCQVKSNLSATKEHCNGNTYLVSTDSDDDRNAQCLTMYRGEVIDVSDNSDSSDSETSSTVSDDNEDSDNLSIRSSSDRSDTENLKTTKVTRTKGELGLQDLPPIEDLKISVDENKCKPVGSVLNIVDEMVVIQSFPNTPPLDIDTILFLDRGQRALGKIFDVFGPVHEPFYSIRFNSADHIREKDIRREQVVYCAPQTEYTSYISVSELLRAKGSDASWTNNNEPPVSCLDFSDDEEEARHKRPKVNTGSKRDTPSDNDQFVKRMNQKNTELTAKRRKEDEAKQKRGSVLRKVIASSSGSIQPGDSLMNAVAHPFTPFSKSRTYTNSGSGSLHGSDSSSTSYFHHPAASVVVPNTHSSSSKYESGGAPRAVNYLRNAAAAAAAAASYSAPPPPALSYTFPGSQHFMCSSPRQLPNQQPPQAPSPAAAVAAAAAAAAAATQNYLAMYHHQQQQRPPSAGPPTAAPPFPHFTAASIPPMPTFVTQPSVHRGGTLPPSFNASVPPPPPPFGPFGAMPAGPLPSSLPQPNFFAGRAIDVAGHHQAATFLPLAMRPGGVPTAFHPQFVLPPPPPPPPPVTMAPHTQPPSPQQQHQPHQRDVTSMGSRAPEQRRNQSQLSHQKSNSHHPSSSPNS